MRAGRQIDLAPWSIVALGAALRLFPVGWGLPDLYEEATPLVQAWEMWNWGPTGSVDLNPHFFNYPSLTLYLHFLVTGLLYLIMKSSGVVGSTLEYSVRYLTDPTPIIVVARCVTAALGAATIWLTWRIGRGVAGRAAAVIASLLLALNPLHLFRSQMIEVDVPLTLFVCATLWFAVRITREPRRNLYLLAGVCTGLAASTKYTGLLVCLPVLVAHLLARRDCGTPGGEAQPADHGRNTSWSNLVLAAAAAGAAFLATSPFVLLDFSAFSRTMALESQHMELGHFGRANASTLVLYGRSLVEQVLGVPLLIVAAAGLIRFSALRREPWALVLASYLLPYFILVVGWSMHADRYLLPLLPGLMIFAGAMLTTPAAIQRRLHGGWARPLLLGFIAFALLIAPAYRGYARLRDRLSSHPLSEVREWFEAEVPAGSFVLTEVGTRLLGVTDVAVLHPEIRAAFQETSDRPVFAVQLIPLFQVAPERSAIFYDLSLYEMADYVVTVNSVRSRYEADPIRFKRQLEFYAALEGDLERMRTFGTTREGATVYRNPRQSVPFAARGETGGPPTLHHARSRLSGSEDLFYWGLAVNYQSYGYLEQAIRAYGLALEVPLYEPVMYQRIVAGMTSCILRHSPVAAAEFLERAAEKSPTPEIRASLEELRERIVRGKLRSPPPGR